MHAWYITSIVPFHPPPLLVNHPQAYRVLKSTLVHSALAFFLETFLSTEEIVLTEENPARHPWAVSGRSFLLSGSAGRVHGRLQISHLAEKKERGEKKHNSVNWICMKMLVIIRMQEHKRTDFVSYMAVILTIKITSHHPKASATMNAKPFLDKILSISSISEYQIRKFWWIKLSALLGGKRLWARHNKQ